MMSNTTFCSMTPPTRSAPTPIPYSATSSPPWFPRDPRPVDPCPLHRNQRLIHRAETCFRGRSGARTNRSRPVGISQRRVRRTVGIDGWRAPGFTVHVILDDQPQDRVASDRIPAQGKYVRVIGRHQDKRVVKINLFERCFNCTRKGLCLRKRVARFSVVVAMIDTSAFGPSGRIHLHFASIDR